MLRSRELLAMLTFHGFARAAAGLELTDKKRLELPPEIGYTSDLFGRHVVGCRRVKRFITREPSDATEPGLRGFTNGQSTFPAR
jgi:hypothetical protein